MITLDFRTGFKKLVGEYQQDVTVKIKECLQLRHEIENQNSSLNFKKRIFRAIVNQICLQNRGADPTDEIMEVIDEKLKDAKIEWLPEYFLRDDAIGINFLMKPKKYFYPNKKEKIIKISNQLMSMSISDWIKNLYELRSDGQTVMGPKSDDDFLKGHGYFDKVPIDRNSKRFLFRTGILHRYSKNKPNPSKFFSTNYNEQYEIFQNALIDFCHDFLSGIEVGGFDLAENPGVVDLILWRHCGESEKYHCKNICGKEPQCNKCCFKYSCLHYLLTL